MDPDYLKMKTWVIPLSKQLISTEVSGKSRGNLKCVVEGRYFIDQLNFLDH